MRIGAKLFPVGLLALVAGCSPASDGQASGGVEKRSGRVAAPGPVSPPYGRAPILPATDPARTRLPAEPAVDAGQPVDGDGQDEAEIRLMPMKPSVVNIPPPAYVPDLPPGEGATEPAPFPGEVTRYMVDRDSCDHFRGEEAYDAERLAYLQENIAELCTGTDARLAMLRQRYANDPAVMSALSGYESPIEGNGSQ